MTPTRSPNPATSPSRPVNQPVSRLELTGEPDWTDADLLITSWSVADRGGDSQPLPGDPLIEAIARRTDLDWAELARRQRVRLRPGQAQTILLDLPGFSGRVIALGAGTSQGAARGPDMLATGASLARLACGRELVLTSHLATASGDDLTRAALGLILAGYRVPWSGAEPAADKLPARRIRLLVADPVNLTPALGRAQLLAEATVRARDLANLWSNVKTPAWIAAHCVDLAAQLGLGCRVWDEVELAAAGFGGLIAVGGGSPNPPRLVRLDYQPPGSRERPIVLVGKGITFDTGGLSIKPSAAMTMMKTDMSGAAAVIATLAGCAQARPERPVIGLLAVAENSVSGTAYRPSDVIRQYGGRTVEVINTDAEGRLVLADALAYADAELDPDRLIDLGTLTGAVTLALGRRHGGLFSNDDELAAELGAAGTHVGETLWRLPLAADYRSSLNSQIADLSHVPTEAGVGGGAITAALFLETFAGGRRWAHLDIAGVGRSEKDQAELVRGATGFGARLLLDWLTR
jgi:leucyl aminopeptidase